MSPGLWAQSGKQAGGIHSALCPGAQRCKSTWCPGCRSSQQYFHWLGLQQEWWESKGQSLWKYFYGPDQWSKGWSLRSWLLGPYSQVLTKAIDQLASSQEAPADQRVSSQETQVGWSGFSYWACKKYLWLQQPPWKIAFIQQMPGSSLQIYQRYLLG